MESAARTLVLFVPLMLSSSLPTIAQNIVLKGRVTDPQWNNLSVTLVAQDLVLHGQVVDPEGNSLQSAAGKGHGRNPGYRGGEIP